MASAYPGLVADISPTNRIESKLVETAAIAPGVVVSRGTDKEKQITTGGILPIGVSVRDLAHENNASDALTYAVGEAVGVITSGSVWAVIANTGNPGDPICYNTTTGAISAGEAGTGQLQLNGTLETVVSSGGDLGRIKLFEQAIPAQLKEEEFTIAFGDLTDEDGAQSFDIATIPANHMVMAIEANVTAAFTDGATGVFTLDLGIKAGDTDVFADGLALGSIARLSAPLALPYTMVAGGTIAADMKADVNVDTATAGSVTFTVIYKDISAAI